MTSANQYFFATRYLLPEGTFDAARQQQQAAAATTRDVNPDAQFNAADQWRVRAASLAALLIICALNVLLLTLALHLREGALASVLMAVAMVLAVLIAASIIAIEQDALRILPNLPFLGEVLP
jgi:ABC-type transport system involved in cytochrome bd biosynthesis fused ATPase/permease subunit